VTKNRACTSLYLYGVKVWELGDDGKWILNVVLVCISNVSGSNLILCGEQHFACELRVELAWPHYSEQNWGRFTHSMPCPCRAHAVPLPCRAAKRLDCVFPIWFTQRGRVWFTLAMPCPCRAHAILWPCRSSQGYGTARPSRDGLWATCPRSASSGYDAGFHEDCYQKHTNPPHNDPYLRL
jgi:hypothetical protein